MGSLEVIRDLRERREAEYQERSAELARLAREARENGRQWPAIAEAMGMTRQGLRKFLARY